MGITLISRALGFGFSSARAIWFITNGPYETWPVLAVKVIAYRYEACAAEEPPGL